MKKSKLIKQYTEQLLQDKNIIFCTDTIYGLGGNAYSDEACLRIFKIKKRPKDNPLIVHVSSLEQLNEFAIISKENKKLIDKFWPGPLTLIFPLKTNHRISRHILLKNNTVAVRMPSINLYLLSACPVAAPSANISGYISPSRYDHALQMYLSNYTNTSLMPYRTSMNKSIESTIFNSYTMQILREGSITQDEIEKELANKCNSSIQSKILVPGMKYKHYSPAVQVVSNLSMRSGIVLNINKIRSQFVGIKKIYLKNNISQKFYYYLHKCEKLAQKHNTYINIEYNNKLSKAVMHKIEKILIKAQ